MYNNAFAPFLSSMVIIKVAHGKPAMAMQGHLLCS